MSKKEATPLSVMTGSGITFFIGERAYTMRPIKLKDIPEFEEDKINIGAQYFSILDEEERKKLNKWLSRYVQDESGEALTLEKAIEEDWDLANLKQCVLRLIDISG